MPPSRRYPLIFNPKARSQRGRWALRFLEGKTASVELFATANEDDACALAARFAEAGEPVVIAAGGDGTLNAVVRGLAGTNTALGVLPTGTMNVFARELGIPCNSLTQAYEVIERGFIKHIDLFAANQVPFVQMAGVGIDAKVIEKCSTGPEGKALLTENVKLAKDLGIGASPTWLANNKNQFSGVAAEQIKKNFCAYNADLKGCAKTLSGDAKGPAGGCGAN